MDQEPIKQVTRKELKNIINDRLPKGLFTSYDRYSNRWIAVDNIGANPIVEEFDAEEQANYFLRFM